MNRVLGQPDEPVDTNKINISLKTKVSVWYVFRWAIFIKDNLAKQSLQGNLKM
jgi:hypothetical protein